MKATFGEWLKGYVLLEISGNGCCRFVHLCANKGMKIRQIDCRSWDQLYILMPLKDFWKIRPVRNKTKVKVNILKKKGYPFIAKKYHLRAVFSVLLFLLIFYVYLRNNYVWKIQVEGNSILSEETIIRYLQKENAGYLVKKASIDADQIEMQMRKDFPSVMWVSISISDDSMYVQLRENAYKTIAQADELQIKGHDLIAAKDATVISIVTRQGMPCVKMLDVVKKGDILVSAIQPIYDDAEEVSGYYISKADADIIGLVTYEYQDEIPKMEQKPKETGRSIKNISFYIGGKNIDLPIPLCLYEEYEQFMEYQIFPFVKYNQIPVSVCVVTKREIKEESIWNKREDAEKIADSHLSQFICNLEENGVSIISKNVIMEECENSYKVSGMIYAKEPIGIRSPKEDIPVDEHE